MLEALHYLVGEGRYAVHETGHAVEEKCDAQRHTQHGIRRDDVPWWSVGYGGIAVRDQGPGRRMLKSLTSRWLYASGLGVLSRKWCERRVTRMKAQRQWRFTTEPGNGRWEKSAGSSNGPSVEAGTRMRSALSRSHSFLVPFYRAGVIPEDQSAQILPK